MKVIIAGSRDYNNYALLLREIDLSGFNITEVVSGGATGVDAMGERYAEENGIPIKHFHADWKAFGRAAGPLRNQKMIEYSDALIVLIVNESKGSTDIFKRAQKANLPYYRVRIEK